MRSRARAEEELIDLTVRVPRQVVERLIGEAQRRSLRSDGDRAALARLLLAGRRRQRALIPGMDLAEADGNMILDLYLVGCSGRRVDVSGVCLASGSPPTTALRHLDALVAAGLMRRDPDPGDRRRCWVTMTPALGAAVERWLDQQLAALRAHDWSDSAPSDQ